MLQVRNFKFVRKGSEKVIALWKTFSLNMAYIKENSCIFAASNRVKTYELPSHI